METILINGLIASGKSTIGKALSEEFIRQNKNSFFYDLDEEVERLNVNHDFESVEKKRTVWLQARKNVAEYINEQKDVQYAIVAGPFFLEDEITGFTDHLNYKEVYLFNLRVPLTNRLKRNDTRELHVNDHRDVEDQDRKFQELSESFGVDIDNTKEIEYTVNDLIVEITSSRGKLTF